jgi:hypothetical protein
VTTDRELSGRDACALTVNYLRPSAIALSSAFRSLDAAARDQRLMSDMIVALFVGIARSIVLPGR